MSTRDFRATQVRTHAIIGSGSSPQLLLYPSASATNQYGGVNLPGTGSDTWMFVSGAIGTTSGKVVFGGDIVVSGTMTAIGGGTGNTFFQSTTQGSLFTTGSAAFRGDESSVDAPSDKGADVFFYVSGTRGGLSSSSKKALFGGDTKISGSLTLAGNQLLFGGTYLEVLHPDLPSNRPVASFSKADDSYSLELSGGLKVNNYRTLSDTEFLGSGSVSLLRLLPSSNRVFMSGTQVTVNAQSVHGGTDVNFFVSGTAGSRGTSVRGTSVFAGDVMVSGTFVTTGITGSNLSISGDTTIGGNLTVNGTTTTVNTTNLVVRDPIVLIGSGAVGTNRNGGIAIASGSSTTGQALVFGRVANDTWGAGKLDVTNGTVTTLAAMDLVNVRAGRFELGGTTSFVSSSGASNENLVLQGTAVHVTGTLKSLNGISGSHTSLTDGRSFLVAGANVTVTSASDGQITIASTGGGGDSFFSSTTAGSIFTTGSTAFRGGESSVGSPSDKGEDVFFYVSGTIGGIASLSRKSLFGGDVVASGSARAERFEIGGSTAYLTTSLGNTVGVMGTDLVLSSNKIFLSGAIEQGFKSLASTNYAVAMGNFVTASNPYAFAQGASSRAGGLGSHAQGQATFASGNYSHAEGHLTVASGSHSHAEGLSTIASGNYSHAEGQGSLASGILSYAAGYFSIASAEGARSLGSRTLASGQYSTAEGFFTTASNSYSHAEGRRTLSTGIGSHTEGAFTTGSGHYSHAEGFYTIASGPTAHAEGDVTTAFGTYSHAEGSGSIAIGQFSHAGGWNTIASGSNQTTVGKFNLRGNDYSLFVIGNGTDDPNVNRSDVLRVETTGLQVTGSGWFSNGISGSHTALADGRSFLVAGSNVTITTASDGQVTIASTGGGGGDSFFSSTTAGSIFTTGSAAFSGAESIDSPLDKGADVFFYVSGAVGSRGTSTVGTAVFGGDVVISGTLFGGSPLKVGTDLQVTGTLSLSSESRFTATAIQLSGSSGVTGSLVIQNDLTSTAQLVLSSTTGFSTLNQTSTGDLEVRNTSLGGNMILGVKTSAGNAVNFVTVRPNGAAVSTLVSVLPGIYAGPANPINSSDTNFFVGGTAGSRGGANRGTSVFGGDVVVSGTLYNPNGVAYLTSSAQSVAGSDSQIQFNDAGSFGASANLTFNSTSNRLSITGSLGIQGDILPDGDRVQNLGSPTQRWAHVYTGDLHLRNERGDYTLIEEEEFLSIRFNKTGKRYRFLLEPVPQLDEDPNNLS